MKFITDDMRLDVKQAVEQLERNTAGELVCVVTQSSARYIMFPLFWAAFISLVLPLANEVCPQAPITFGVQSASFIGLALLFLFTPLRLCVTPRRIRDANCRRMAFEQFFMQRMHMTGARTGVLLFVSVDEHYVELLADQGINAKVLPDEWDGITADFVRDVRDGKVHDGFMRAVNACAHIMAKHFPKPDGDLNELPDPLVELPPAGFVS